MKLYWNIVFLLIESQKPTVRILEGFPTVGGKEMHSQSAAKWDFTVTRTTRWLVLPSVFVLQREGGVTQSQPVKVVALETVCLWCCFWSNSRMRTISYAIDQRVESPGMKTHWFIAYETVPIHKYYYTSIASDKTYYFITRPSSYIIMIWLWIRKSLYYFSLGLFWTTVGECSPLGNPDHGTTTALSLTHGSRVEFTCFKGYSMSGSALTQCNADGSWSDPVPSCNGT